MAVVMIVSGVGGLFLTSGTASADVDSVEGTGFGISATVLGAEVIPPTPDPTQTPPRLVADESSTNFGPLTTSVITIGGILGVLEDGVAVGPVATQASNIVGENHLGSIGATSQVANVNILNGAINIPLIQSSCVANGDGSVGATNISNATIGNSQLLDGPVAPNTVIDVLGLATVILNEQVVTNTPPSGGNPGQTSITVNAAHVLIPDDGGVADIILAQSFCRATGPDVLLVTTTAPPTTAPGTTAPPTTAPATTAPPTTAPGTTAPPTTAPPSGTIATTTTQAQVATTTTRAGVLVRTGQDLQPLAVMSALSIVLGILLLIGSGRPLTANAGGPALAGGTAPYAGAGPEKWGPVEIAKTIWAGLAALVIGLAKLFGPRRRGSG